MNDGINLAAEIIQDKFDTLMSDITKAIDDIETNTVNVFIIKKCAIIEIKLEEIGSKRYNNIETVESICNSIINNDISNMKRTLNQAEEMQPKYEKLEELVSQIPSCYTP